MGLSISAIRAKGVRSVSVDVMGDPINFDYTPAAFTPELEQLTQDKDGELKLNTPNILIMLGKLIVGWDLTVDPVKKVKDRKVPDGWRDYDPLKDGAESLLPKVKLPVDPSKNIPEGALREYIPEMDGPLTPLPLELGLTLLPKGYLMDMLNEIVKDLNPKQPTEETSSAS